MARGRREAPWWTRWGWELAGLAREWLKMARLARKLALLGRELTRLVVRGGKLARLTHP